MATDPSERARQLEMLRAAMLEDLVAAVPVDAAGKPIIPPPWAGTLPTDDEDQRLFAEIVSALEAANANSPDEEWYAALRRHIVKPHRNRDQCPTCFDIMKKGLALQGSFEHVAQFTASYVQRIPFVAIAAPAQSGAADGNDLIAAASAGDLLLVKVLIAAGADVNAKHAAAGMTALIAASYEGHLAAIRVLLDAGADVNATSADGFTALMMASNLEVVRVLLDAGADVNAKATAVGMTALTKASHEGQLEVVRVLLDAGADVNAVLSDGVTAALMLASCEGHLEVVQLLKNAGAREPTSNLARLRRWMARFAQSRGRVPRR
jgi:hypothetical protein